ncbi:MAG TPA: MFS transporter [Pseudonocardiaceae bacterium]|jgi:MFS family permease|nr:MFS transporter [Pseudonocardiaceae bacterium]
MSSAPTGTAREGAPQGSLWRDRRFLTFSGGVFVNSLGDGVYTVALPLLAYDLTRSLQVMVLLAAAFPVALLVSGPLFGYVADRYGSRVLVVPGLAAQFIAALGLNLLLGMGKLDTAVLVACQFIVQVGGAAYRSGWFASLPSLFPAQPGQARGILAAQYEATTILGPLLAGALVGPLGYQTLLWLNLITFTAPALVWLTGIRAPRENDGGAAALGIVKSLAEGWQVLRRSRPVFIAMLLLIPCELLASTGTLNLSLYYLRNDLRLSNSLVSGVVAVVNLAAMVCALLMSRRRRIRLRTVATLALSVLAVGLLVLPVPVALLVVPALVAVFGAYTAVTTAAEILLYDTLPREVIGRIYGLWRLICGSASALGPLVISTSSAVLGTRGAFLTLGILALVPVGWLLRNRRRDWDRAQVRFDISPSD